MDDNLDDVVANIKATLNSSQNKITLEALNRDYTSVVGCGIPFRRLKFSSLEELIRAAPGLSLNRIGSQTFVEVKADAKTAHIAKLVREQKTAKKKSGRGRGPRRNFGGPPRNNYNRSASYRNPPPRLQNNNYSHRSYNSHDNRRKESENKTSSYSNASENRTNSYSNYRSTQPCTYNFSDDDDDYLDDFADLPSSEEEEEVAKAPEPIVTRPPEPIVTRPREPNLTTNFTNLHITVENKHFGGGITNTRLRGGLRMASKSYPHRTSSAEVDVGYSSMKNKLGRKDYPKPYNPDHFRRDDVSIVKNNVCKVYPKFDDWDDTVPESRKNYSSVNDKFDDWDDSVDLTSDRDIVDLTSDRDIVDLTSDRNIVDLTSDRDTSAGILDDWDDSVDVVEVDEKKNNRVVSSNSRCHFRSHEYESSDSESSNVYDEICISSAQKYEKHFEREDDEPKTMKLVSLDGKRRRKSGESTASRITRLLTQQAEEPHRQTEHGESVCVTISNGFTGGRVVHLL